MQARLRWFAKFMGKELALAERRLLAEMRKQIADVQLPMIKAWTDRLHKRGEVCIHGGGTYQARCDTRHRPGHSDWSCLASPGMDGMDGKSWDDDHKRGDVIDWRGKRGVA